MPLLQPKYAMNVSYSLDTFVEYRGGTQNADQAQMRLRLVSIQHAAVASQTQDAICWCEDASLPAQVRDTMNSQLPVETLVQYSGGLHDINPNPLIAHSGGRRQSRSAGVYVPCLRLSAVSFKRMMRRFVQ